MELSIINFNELINCPPFLDGFSIIFPYRWGTPMALVGCGPTWNVRWREFSVLDLKNRGWTRKMVVFFMGKMMINHQFFEDSLCSDKTIYVFGFVWSKMGGTFHFHWLIRLINCHFQHGNWGPNFWTPTATKHFSPQRPRPMKSQWFHIPDLEVGGVSRGSQGEMRRLCAFWLEEWTEGFL